MIFSDHSLVFLLSAEVWHVALSLTKTNSVQFQANQILFDIVLTT